MPEPTPSNRAFTPDHPDFRLLSRTGESRFYSALYGDKHGRAYTWNPHRITYQEMDEMRFDGQIRAGMTLLKVPILRSPWSVSCADSEIAAFVKEALRPIWRRLVRQLLLSMDFGFSVGELVWRHQYNLEVTGTQSAMGGKGSRVYPHAVVLDDVQFIDPQIVRLLAYTKSSKFAGFEQITPVKAVVPDRKCIHLANEFEFAGLYGVPRLKAAYPYWRFKRLQYENLLVGYERNANSRRVVRYPVGETETGVDEDGNPQTISNQDVALDIGEQADGGNTIAIPSRYDDRGNRLWDIEFPPPTFQGSDHLAFLDHLNAEILKSLLIPELALSVGSSGSYNLAEVQINFFLQGLEATAEDLCEAVNRYIVKPLVRIQFGVNAPVAMVRIQPMTQEVKSGLVNVLMSTVGQGQPIPLKDGSSLLVDWSQVAEDLGIPAEVLTEEELAMYRKAAESNQPQQPQMPGQEGGEGEGEDGGDQSWGTPPSEGRGGNEDPDYDDAPESADLSDWTIPESGDLLVWNPRF